MIAERRVSVNGRVIGDPDCPTRRGDRIEVDGKLVGPREKVYLILNKPRGLVTTASDEKGRDTVYKLLPAQLPWVAPVGRLDRASEGLLLMTNDPEWAARLLAPEAHIEKVYHVRVSAVPDAALLAALCRGVEHSGDLLRVKRVDVVRRGKRNAWLEVVLEEGKNRHIRRMFEALGIEVLRLVRVAIGPIALGGLPKGSFRQLTSAEKRRLDQLFSSD